MVRPFTEKGKGFAKDSSNYPQQAHCTQDSA